MGKKLTLILGGARSGKSSYAQALAEARHCPTLYVATAEAGDDEMALRIIRHRQARPPNWETLEAPRLVGKAIEEQSGRAEVVLFDCLTLLASNLISPLVEPIDEDFAQALLDGEVDSLLEAYAKSQAEWFIISNEVGLGLVPPYPLGRVYRDALGRANQRIAQAADEVILMVAGIAVGVK
jgi:adenosylcobinamide kinase / adenosylcobinamide-phosphate guanylyltransferase